MGSWTNHVKANLKAGKPQIGTWMTLPGVHYCYRLAMAGFDWIMVDTEHSPTGNQGMAEAVATLVRSTAVPFVRVPRGTLEDIKRAYDCGAWGVLSPMVNSREEAEQIVSWSKYPPRRRAFGWSLRPRLLRRGHGARTSSRPTTS